MHRPPLRETLISVVLPVYNEAHVLEELHRRVSDAVAQCGTRQEIVFVNDGSTDASPEILDSIAAQHRQRPGASTYRATSAIRRPCRPVWPMPRATRSC